MKSFIVSIAVLALGVSAVACSHQAPSELQDARVAYQRAAQHPGAGFAGPELTDARKTLAEAEQLNKDGEDAETKHVAYIAQRKSIGAAAKASAATAQQSKLQALADLEQAKAQYALNTKQQLDRTKTALSAAQQEAANEREARAKSEAAFAAIQGVKAEQQDRGLVLTISGSVLFASSKADILPTSHARLRELATALKEDQRSIMIIGHTDSTGSAELNDRLSQQRADSVKAYLVKEGVPADRIQTQGAGPSQPVASNDKPEGRANNRRVEIILLSNGTPERTNTVPSKTAPKN